MSEMGGMGGGDKLKIESNKKTIFLMNKYFSGCFKLSNIFLAILYLL